MLSVADPDILCFTSTLSDLGDDWAVCSCLCSASNAPWTTGTQYSQYDHIIVQRGRSFTLTKNTNRDSQLMEVLPRHGDVDRDFSVGEFYLKDAKRRSRHSSNADHRLVQKSLKPIVEEHCHFSTMALSTSKSQLQWLFSATFNGSVLLVSFNFQWSIFQPFTNPFFQNFLEKIQFSERLAKNESVRLLQLIVSIILR